MKIEKGHIVYVDPCGESLFTSKEMDRLKKGKELEDGTEPADIENVTFIKCKVEDILRYTILAWIPTVELVQESEIETGGGC